MKWKLFLIATVVVVFGMIKGGAPLWPVAAGVAGAALWKWKFRS